MFEGPVYMCVHECLRECLPLSIHLHQHAFMLVAENSSVDAAIFCLALMGTDYGSFLTEACRVLRKGGLLWIAEVRSRFADSTSSAESGGKDVFASFVAALKKLGLHVTRQDSSNKMFVVFTAKKVDDKKNGAVQWPELKPCMYKRR